MSRAAILGLYVGRAQPLPEDGRSSGIIKHRIDGPVAVTELGLMGDQQADLRVHGGPEKALHQFSRSSYDRLAAVFAEQSGQLVPGSIGENISTEHFDESSVCIGDVFALGSARVQVSQPRSPCWKIDARYGREGICAAVAKHGIAGWYYRVLDGGRVQVGDALALLERNPKPLSLADFHRLARTHRPSPADLFEVADTPGLNPQWGERIRARARWLQDQA